MGRKASHRISKPHPSPKFRDTVRLLSCVRSEADTNWYAQFHIDGVWVPPNNPVSLSTRDWDQACENARDRYTLAVNGVAPVAVPRKAAPRRTFGEYAARTIADLTERAIDADAKVKGKGHNFRTIVSRIETLVEKWGGTPIADISEHMLNDWVEDEYRVVDRTATAQRGEVVRKRPAVTTLGNLDQAFEKVWAEAVKSRVVDRRKRPVIDKTEHGEDGENRPFIDEAVVFALAKVMTDEWIAKGARGDGHGTAYKRRLRCCIAVAAATGIRAGLELERIKIGAVQFRKQQGHGVIIIQVTKRQGKHLRARPVVLFEGSVFPVRRLLIDLLQHRREEGATDNDLLFGWRKDGEPPQFRAGLNTVLREANCLYDPTTGKNRVMYSFRHYFATLLISRGLSVGKIAEWLGTSSSMIEKHYNRYLVEREAYLVNGSAPPEPISNYLLYQEPGDPDEEPYFDGLDTKSVTKGL
jgi:integrase